ncbi:hypothetical protein Fmac_000706 [Flemingia macrophylla]|uniref:Sugar phosphate transporter domain-containing protein n=1 Tax=Flemingia macrophylla TaxID=520843 RepID=A0ABD1NEZ7_9FABA
MFENLMKASYSSENLMLPVSDPPNEEDRERLLKVDNNTFGRRWIYAAISYMSCAVLLVLFNKAALSSYHFPSASVITLLQLVTMESVRGVNVPMYTTLRRTTVVFTMFMEYMLVGQRYTPPVISSVSLIVFGAFIAGARDFSFDAYGYAIVFLSNITTAIYLATIACVGCIRKTSGLNSFGLMWCNGMLCLSFSPYTAPELFSGSFDGKRVVCLRNQVYAWKVQKDQARWLSCVVLLFSCLLAFFLNYSIFLNTTLNSALTQTICGNLKWNVVGQCLGFVGSGLYAYYKLIGNNLPKFFG